MVLGSVSFIQSLELTARVLVTLITITKKSSVKSVAVVFQIALDAAGKTATTVGLFETLVIQVVFL